MKIIYSKIRRGYASSNRKKSPKVRNSDLLTYHCAAPAPEDAYREPDLSSAPDCLYNLRDYVSITITNLNLI